MEEINVVHSSTPYDDVFRTLLNDCCPLILPIINEVFGESYQGNEEIVFFPNEHFLNRQAGAEQERITDTNFMVLGKEAKKYHWECQSSTDNSMLVRLFEYDAQIALDQGKIIENTLIVTFPHSAVLFLRCNRNTPDRMKVEIRTPGTNAAYEIPVMKTKQYSIDDIFDKKLLFLIPFHIFSYENSFEEYNSNMEQLNTLMTEYRDIRHRLERLTEHGQMNEYTKCTIIDMSNKVLDHLADNYKKVKEGVKSVMGGKVLEYEAKTIKREGRKEGRIEGKLEMLFELVQDNLISLQEAASRAQLPEAEFQEQMRRHSRA